MNKTREMEEKTKIIQKKDRRNNQEKGKGKEED